MRSFICNHKILLTVILVTVAVSIVVTGMRWNVEKQNKTYDIILDFDQIARMAEQSEHDIDWWLQDFKDMGITRVGLTEANLTTLMEESDYNVTAEVMDNVRQESSWQEDYPAAFVEGLALRNADRFDVLVSLEGESVPLVTDAVRARFHEEQYFIVEQGSEAYIWLDGTSDVTLYSDDYKYMNSIKKGFAERRDIESSKLMYISLGLLPSEVETVKAVGMEIVPRTLAYNGYNDTNYAEAVVDGYEAYGITPHYLIVGGEAVMGYDDGEDFARNYIADDGITIGLIENTTQLQNIMQFGVEDIAKTTDYSAVRVFSVWEYIQYRYQYYGYPGAEEIENTLYRAVTERNIRVIYYKPIMETNDRWTYVTDPEIYENMFASLQDRLAAHNITFGDASVMKNLQVPFLLKFLMGIGCAAAGLLLLQTFLPLSRKVTAVLGALCLLALVGAAYVLPSWFELMVSFGNCVVFGCLGVSLVTASAKRADRLAPDAGLPKILGLGALTAACAVVWAVIGGMMTSAPIDSVNYLLEIDCYRGVKVGELAPIAFFVIAYLAYFGFGNRKRKPGILEFQDLKDMMTTSIKVWMCVLACIVAGMGVYYMLRTGHDSSIEVSSFEMLARNKLEELLIARPRTKEFLIGIPAVMLFVYCVVRRFRLWSILFGLGSCISVVSVINTFEHIRTPLYLGFARTGYSLVMGIAIGICGVLVFELCHFVYDRYLRRYVERDYEAEYGQETEIQQTTENQR